jgi:hypothetical protein
MLEDKIVKKISIKKIAKTKGIATKKDQSTLEKN